MISRGVEQERKGELAQNYNHHIEFGILRILGPISFGITFSFIRDQSYVPRALYYHMNGL